MRSPRGILFALLTACLALVASSRANNTQGAASTPAPPGPILTGLQFERPAAADGLLLLSGSHAQRQLLVTGKTATGRLIDVTRAVTYSAQPAGVVTIDASGWLRPLANGEVLLTARHRAGQTATVRVSVQNWGKDRPVHFANQVVPIFTKFGCNGGGCHGKSGGQNGFRLSLLGFVPTEDYQFLAREARGRRLMVSAPEQSLLLRKATGALPHGGGTRLEAGDPSYEVLRRWIAEGGRWGDPHAATMQSIRVLPCSRVMAPHARQQLVVLAQFTDGHCEDVTRLAKYEANFSELAGASETGLVTTNGQTGDVAVMIRYQSQVAVFRATIPLGAALTSLPPARNFIDTLVFQKLRQLGLPPSDLCNDGTFLRRVSIDITGRLPALAETRAFLSDDAPDKRDQCINRLLASDEHAEYFANKWSAILRNSRKRDEQKRRTYLFHDWIRTAIHQNMPYDQFVRALVTASGEVGSNPPVAWYENVREMTDQVEDMAQLFLGLRIQCARCHHHPFEKWSQQDYYGLAAFFSHVGRKSGAQPAETRIFHRWGVASATNPKTGQPVAPTPLAGQPISQAPQQDPRGALVDWMTAADNPFFARALVNRYWKHFLDRGLVEPEDDMRETNPPANPELLDALAKRFVDSGYDMQALIRTICQSRVYQLQADPNEFNATDRQSYSRFYPRRLQAEVLLDALDQFVGTTTSFAGMPAATRAVQLPDPGLDVYFLNVFGRPRAMSACECERTSDANLVQSLHLLNSASIQKKLAAESARPHHFAQDTQRDRPEKIRETYLRAFCREPTEQEMADVLAYLAEHGGREQTDKPRDHAVQDTNVQNQPTGKSDGPDGDGHDQKEQAGKGKLATVEKPHEGQPKAAKTEAAARQAAYEDLYWALINSKEFLFNH